MILITGSNGFLGKYIYQECLKKHDVDSINRTKSTYNLDLSNSVPHLNKSYDVVVHVAGKAHSVPKTEAENKEFYDVNVNGTKNLLTALTNSCLLPKAFVFISSVSVYGVESGCNIHEDLSLDAVDSYGKSKIAAELIVQEWCTENNVICAILRLPLIAGANPPGNLGTMVRGINKGYYFNIAGGKAKKSIVLAADVAGIIIEAANKGGIYNLTDGYHPSFSELADLIATQLHKRSPASIPGYLARLMARIGDIIGAKAPIDTNKLKKISSDLTFDDSKARRLLGWKPNQVLSGFRIK